MGLEDADIPILEEILTNNSTLIKLDLSNNHFTEKGILKLQGILSEKQKLFFVELSGISITPSLQKYIQDELSPETRLLAMLNGHELDTECTMDWPYIQTLCQYATEISQRSESTSWQWTHVAVSS